MAKIDDSVKKKVPELRFAGFADDWEQRKLGEVATLSSSKRIHLSDYVTEGIPFYRGSEISTGGITGNQELFISQEKFDEIKEKYGVPSEGDILVTAVGTLGNLWKVDSRRFYYKDGNLIQISKMQVNSDYLLTYFTGGIGKKRLLDSAAGSNQKALTMVKMREITIDFPSEDEQQKIGSFFKQLDKTIALHQHKLDLLKEQKKGYLQKMFPKNGEKVPELRFAGFADDWEERKLGDIVVKAIDNRGKTPPTSENDKYPLLEVASIGGYYPNYSKVTKFVNYNIFNSWFRAHLKKGDILFSTVGNTGLATLMDDNQDATIAQNIVGFRAKNSNVPEFLLQMFKLPSNLKKAKRIEMGAVQPSIKVSQLIEVQYLLPKCKHEQEKIGSFFKQLDDTIALHQHKLDLLKEQKKGFLQKMFV
ncbi:restriction endonuclease subunit S [Lactococcus sp. SK2-659]|uniref:restriction endonuclease subunit S n=1 Tax=Lactococcus sp. SK2-659 TaxID=2879150 RepID=UPI001CDC4C3D|nr:restriction endonuclease subunit S [Lactococcus sp. SK2-659]MCA2382395.1 restriction endonuclease subunit S [Lactococcus sp. SK2-659]